MDRLSILSVRLPIDAGEALDLEAHTNLFERFAVRSLLDRLARLGAAAGDLPVVLSIVVLHEQHATLVIDDD